MPIDPEQLNPEIPLELREFLARKTDEIMSVFDEAVVIVGWINKANILKENGKGKTKMTALTRMSDGFKVQVKDNIVRYW